GGWGVPGRLRAPTRGWRLSRADRTRDPLAGGGAQLSLRISRPGRDQGSPAAVARGASGLYSGGEQGLAGLGAGEPGFDPSFGAEVPDQKIATVDQDAT